jgi:hypothetical protein
MLRPASFQSKNSFGKISTGVWVSLRAILMAMMKVNVHARQRNQTLTVKPVFIG